eukprot:2179450-Amphidinium_carterae.3
MKSAGRTYICEEYVDDMVLVAKGPCFVGNLCHAYRQVPKSLTQAIMKVCNGANAKRLLMKVWRAGRLPPPKVTTRDLGVDC